MYAINWMINICLTLKRYHSQMLKSSQKYGQTHTGKRATIWLSLLIALGMHTIFLYLPVSLQTDQISSAEKLLELHLGKRPEPQSSTDTYTAEETAVKPEPELPPEPETPQETQDPATDKVADNTFPAEQAEPPPTLTEPFTPYTRTSFDNMTDIENNLSRHRY